MPFNVASIKDRAAHAKDASVNRFQNTRDKYSSTPAAKTKFTEDGLAISGKAPPPPPPPLLHTRSKPTNVASSVLPRQAAPPPPISRNTRPGIPIASPAPIPAITHSYEQSSSFNDYADEPEEEVKIDWTNLSEEDKEVFFAWLDEFFEGLLQRPVRPAHAANVSNPVKKATPPMPSRSPAPVPVPAPQPVKATAPPLFAQHSSGSEDPSRGPPPVIKSWSKPTSSSASSVPFSQTSNTDFTMSHPPSTAYGSAALDLAHYFQPDVSWDTAWFASDNLLPPPLHGSTDITWTASQQWVGNDKTLSAAVFFSDLSICWFRVVFDLSNPDPWKTQRMAEYIPCPAPMDKEALIEAHETYGESIASFAESFEGTGQFCARGECWDLANEAIKYFADYDYIPKPIPSISRTHGHLIFEGKAMGKNRQVGRWRGGDDRVRRGDIVEWRKVKINVVNALPGSWAKLGDPDHTAVIVSDSVPLRSPRDSESLLPSELVQLEVVEQSVHSAPQRKAYDMAAFEEGEVWIYRPIGMQAYLGTIFGVTPQDVRTYRV